MAAETTLPATGSKLRTDVIRLGLFDHLDNEVVVWPGYSDWGDLGWFLGKETNWDEEGQQGQHGEQGEGGGVRPLRHVRRLVVNKCYV